ncbi:MAG: hypothetical protein P8Y48_18250 [Novosphingobium sp.]
MRIVDVNGFYALRGGGRWIMHADPLAAYAYRWFGRVANEATIDRWFSWYWRHLLSLAPSFHSVICANAGLSARLRRGGIGNACTIGFGVEAAASGVLAVVPDRGGAAEAASDAALHYDATCGLDMVKAIARLATHRGVIAASVQKAAREKVRTMDDHFDDLFSAYRQPERVAV